MIKCRKLCRFFPCQGEIKIYARMPTESPPKEIFVKQEPQQKRLVELIDNFSRVVLSGIFLLPYAAENIDRFSEVVQHE